MIIVDISTTLTEEITSSRLGHTTFLSSAPHSLQNRIIFPIPASQNKDTGQEGLEPSTFGFGDRRSTIGATDLEAIHMYGIYTLPIIGKNKTYFAFASLCNVCFRSNGQYFFSSSLPCIFLRFLYVV